MKFHFSHILILVIALFIMADLYGITSNTFWNFDHNTQELHAISVLTMPFVENTGQINNDEVRYYAQTFGGAVYITGRGELLYSLPKNGGTGVDKGWVIKESFSDASIVSIRGEDETETRVSYFKGKDPLQWSINLPVYNAVNVKEIYDGIDLHLQAYGNNVEKRFTVKPGACPEKIKVQMDGIQSLNVGVCGELEIRTAIGSVSFTKPVAYQDHNGKKQFVDVAYIVQGDIYGFKVGKYDRAQELIIDPLLASTFIGGSSNEYGHSIAIDENRNVYVAGYTYSSNYPITPGAYDTSYNDNVDIFVSKLDSNLTTLLASTYLGGSEGDFLHGSRAITVDGNGDILVAAGTESPDFPYTPGVYDTTYNDSADGVVFKLDSTLTTLLASTFIGGSDDDGCYSIAVDESGNVYVTGVTFWMYVMPQSDFPVTPGAYDTLHGTSWDVFVSKFDNDLTTLFASTFLGGESIDRVTCATMDEDANIYLTGYTSSSDFPTTPDAYDTSYADPGGPFWNYDVFISSLDSSLSTLNASTFLGMIPDEEAYGICLNADANVYVTGWTASDSFPTTPGAYSEEFNGGARDAFISKFDANVTTLLASTFLGGSNQNDYSRSLAYDGDIFVTGYTHSSDFPTTPNAFDTSYNGGYSDAWVSRLDSNLTMLIASTYLGGSINPGVLEQSNSIAIGNNRVYVCGMTPSSDFPVVPGCYNEIHGGGRDIFVSKFDRNLSYGLGINEEKISLHTNHILSCTPNPFRNRVHIKLMVEDGLDGIDEPSLKIYDVSGRLVKSFLLSSSVLWDGVDTAGKKLPEGVYFLKLHTDDYNETEKLLMVR